MTEYRHATEDRIPELQQAGFEVVSYVYDRGGQACFLMRKVEQNHPPRAEREQAMEASR